MRLQGFTRTGWAGAAAVAVGCSGSHAGSKASLVTSGAQVGEVHADLSVGAGESIGRVSWSITPPAGVSAAFDAALSGAVDVSSSGVAMWTTGGLPAARGYSLLVAATTTDGAYVCASSTTFDIAPEQVSHATLTLACHPTAVQVDAGSVSLTLTTSVSAACTGLTSVSASPVGTAELCQSSDGVAWAQTMQLVATAIDSQGNTSDEFISYAWTVSPAIGTFDKPTSATPVFTCVGAPSDTPAEITVTTSAPGAPTCGGGAVTTFPVNCLPTDCPPTSLLCDCHVCTDPATDDANCGSCGNACPSGSVCSRGVCMANDAGEDGD